MVVATTEVAEGLDWLAGTGEGSVAELGAALEGEETLRAALEGGLDTYMLSASRAGSRAASTAGSTTTSRSRGVEPAEIRPPVLVVQGRQDLMVPGGHGDWLANRIPRAEASFSEDEGHVTLMQSSSVRRIHEWPGTRL